MIRPYLAILAVLCAPTILVQAQLFDPTGPEQRARDDARLEAARARRGSVRDDTQALREREAAQRQTLARLESELAGLRARHDELSASRAQLGDDAAEVYALARSTAADLANRTRGRTGSIDLAQRATHLAQAPAELDSLYELWLALHEELVQGARVEVLPAPVTFADGVRVEANVTLFGHILAVAAGRRLEPGPDGLLEASAPLPAAVDLPPPPGAWRLSRPPAELTGGVGFARQRAWDSGWLGGLIGLCALAAALLALYQSVRLSLWRRLLDGPAERLHSTLTRRHFHPEHGGEAAARRFVSARDRGLNVLATAAMLLGLLGTVVGLIQTFRTLALHGGTESALAAQGIAHALSTTWLGLCVAVPALLAGAALAAWRQRIERRLARRLSASLTPSSRRRSDAGATAAPASTRRNPAMGRPWGWRRVAGRPLALTAGGGLGVTLFLIMYWLIGLAPTDAPAAVPVAQVERITWREPPPEPPPTREQQTLPDDPGPSNAAAASLPSVAPAPLATASLAFPALSSDTALSGLSEGGGRALSGVAGEWLGATGETGFAGKDLVPISSARPRYPRAAARERLEGWVELMFRIGADGRVSDIRVLDSEPPGVFENAAADAMSRWLYAPLYRNGQPVVREATQLFRFGTEDIDELYLYEGN